MIRPLLPAAVVAVEAFEDHADVVLYPEEEAVVARAVERRRAEFATARSCARRALSALGLPPAPLLSGGNREPLWPDGVVGSITHCRGYRAAAVARAADIATVGIDAEPHDVLPDGVLETISLAEERDWLRALSSAAPSVCWDRLLFSAKESVYKAWFPLARRWLGFEDAAITIDRERATFDARLLVPGPVRAGREVTRFTGRWAVGGGLVLTAIALDGQAGGDGGPAVGS